MVGENWVAHGDVAGDAFVEAAGGEDSEGCCELYLWIYQIGFLVGWAWCWGRVVVRRGEVGDWKGGY